MSQKNVEIVRRVMEAYLAGDNEAALSAYDPEVEFDVTVRPDGRIYHRRDGVAEAMRVWSGAWADWEVDVEDLVDAGDRVLLVARESGRGKGSGMLLDHVVYWVFKLRDGRIIHAKGFTDRDQAAQAVALNLIEKGERSEILRVCRRRTWRSSVGFTTRSTWGTLIQ